MSLESVLDTLEATQEVHQHTCLDARGTPRVQAQLKKSPVFLLLISRRRSISLLCRERIPGIPITPQGEAVSTLTSSGTPGVLPQFHKTLISQSTPYIPDSPGLNRLPPRVSTQNAMAGVTTLWPSRESHGFLCQLDRKPSTAFPAREEQD